MAAIKLPPGYRKTALQAVEGIDLTDKVVLVTGGSSGIGIECVRAFVHAGAHVINAVRNLEKAQPIMDEIKSSTGKDKVELMKLDLASLSSVKEFAAAFNARGLPIDKLILNAGVMALPERTLTGDGHEMMFQVNWLSNMLLLNLLKPSLLKASSGSRVVIVSSCAHLFSDFLWEDPSLAKAYDKRIAYASSKTAAIMLSNEFNRRNIDKGITCNALHPGGIMTGLQKHMTTEEKQKLGWINEKGEVNPLFKTVEEGASTQTWAAVAPELEGRGGLYLEDCAESVPHTPEMRMSGYQPWVKDEEKDAKLWKLGEEILGQTF